MERDFYELYELAISERMQLTVNVNNNPVSGWGVELFDMAISRDTPIISVQNCDRLCVFADAFSQLSKHFLEMSLRKLY